MAMGREQRLANQIVDAVCDERFSNAKFGHIAQNQPISILCLEASAFLSFFEMLSIRWDHGDMNSEDHDLLRLSKRITQAWHEETQDR